MLDESLAVALEAGEVEHACRAYVNIVWHLIDSSVVRRGRRILDDAIDLADEAEFVGFRRYLQLTRSMVYLARGWWDEAEREIRWAVDAEPIIRCPALVVLGTIQARRGQELRCQLLEQAWTIAEKLGEAQRTGPAAAALLEAAWLRGDASGVASVVAPAYEDVRRFGRVSSAAAEFGYRLRAAGHAVPINDSEHPYTLLAQRAMATSSRSVAARRLPVRAGARAHPQLRPRRPAVRAHRARRIWRRAAGAQGAAATERSSASAASRVAASKPHETTPPDSPSGRPT